MTANELDLPQNLFLEAVDYNPAGKKPASDLSQGNVARARRRSLAELRQLHDNLGKAITNLSVADSQGYMGYGVDVLQGVNNDMAKAIGKLSKAVANAEDRYDKALLKAAAPAETTPQPVSGGINQINATTGLVSGAVLAMTQGHTR